MLAEISTLAQAGGLSTFFNTVVKGLAIGGVYSIIALGFVIIFKATQVVNFAQGALAAIGGLFVSFMVFDKVGQNPKGQTPFTTWRAPFAGEGLPDVADQWASLILVSVLAGILVTSLTGRAIPGAGLGLGVGSFMAMEWATGRNVTQIDGRLGLLLIALAVGIIIGLATGWRPADARVRAATGVMFLTLLLAVASDAAWLDWVAFAAIAVWVGLMAQERLMWGIAAAIAGTFLVGWLATRSGFTWLEDPLPRLLIAIALGMGVALWRGWSPSGHFLISAGGTFAAMLVIAALGLGWLEWLGYLVIAIIFGALLGMFLERIAIRPMVGEPLFSMAVITLGLEIVLRVFANDAVKILNRPIEAPWRGDPLVDATPGGFKWLDAFYNYSWFAILGATAIAFVTVYFFYRSKLGVAMRAVSFDQEAAMAQGINVGQVFAIAWAFGTALAVVGGVFATQPPIDQAGAVGLTTALVAFRALPAVILGGLDSVQGALVGGLLIGLAEIFAGQYLAAYTSTLGPGYQQIVPYIVMLGVLLVRPFGLFGTPEVRRV